MGQSKSLLLKLSIALILGITLPASSIWAAFVKTANKYNKPGEFTAFIAYEYTSIPNGRNMHRNAGHENLAIPHNGNVSDGWMFSPNEFLGDAMDARYAKRQALNEPLFEMLQTKGSSDTHPLLSPNDEFANFELFQNMINVGQPSQITYGYFRQGLVEGMILTPAKEGGQQVGASGLASCGANVVMTSKFYNL